jgi:NTP pyrophosphatase (non-canonical NTP hydrolase)
MERPFIISDEPSYTPAPMVTPQLVAVLRDVVKERQRQDAKWGPQDHHPVWWMSILMEEVGEAAQEVLALKFGDAAKARGDLREELLHVAAVAVSAVEALDFGAAGLGRAEATATPSAPEAP